MAVKTNYRTGMPFYLTPVFMQNERVYITGMEELSPQKKGVILKALGSSTSEVEDLQVPINHGKILNIDQSDEDFGVYSLALISNEVANNLKSVDPDKHLFYLSDPEGEATEELTNEMLVIKAKNKIVDEGGDFEKLLALALYLGGMDLKGLSLNVVTRKLLKEAEMQPQNIIKFYEEDHGAHVMVKELDFYGVIDNREGFYYDGSIRLGTLNEAIEFIKNEKNQDQVASLGKRLIEEKKNKAQ